MYIIQEQRKYFSYFGIIQFFLVSLHCKRSGDGLLQLTDNQHVAKGQLLVGKRATFTTQKLPFYHVKDRLLGGVRCSVATPWCICSLILFLRSILL